jgi:pyruvate formate lyase activating enzyme
VEHCASGAVEIKGTMMEANGIIARAVRMKPFFAHSGGGVTLTGGEVAEQIDFAEAVLGGCRAEGIHTAIETSGACTWAVLERLVAVSDLILYDLKSIDDTLHRKWTGGPNGQILDNARKLAGRNVEIRIPLIPAITDTEDNLRAIFRFMREAGLKKATVLRYNTAASSKYDWLDLSFTISGRTQTGLQLDEIVKWGTDEGVDVRVG